MWLHRVDPVRGQLELFVDFLGRTDEHVGSLVSGDGIVRSALSVDIVIAVADTGVGIPQTDRERLFRPFEKGAGGEGPGGTASGKNDSGATGPGLGLTLVRNFVELHGGTVEVKSAAGRGTTVTCRLPIQLTDA